MDFIEKWFGLSPDNGDGSTEVLYLVAAAVILAFVIWRVTRRRVSRRSRPQ